jgi:hypothetical protein
MARAKFFGLAQSGSPIDILGHPDTESAQSKIIYQPHIPTVNGTAGYADVRKFMEQHWLLVHVMLCIQISFIVGDQQSFSRMVWLKRMEAGAYDSIIPLPGDFHAAVHMLMAMHILWWEPLVCWLVDKTGFCEASIHETWSSVELYNRYRFFYEAIIVGVISYIIEVVPPPQLQQPEILLEYAKHNNRGRFPEMNSLQSSGVCFLLLSLPLLYRCFTVA